MEAASPKDTSSSVASSPLSSPSIGTLLKIKILSWSQETGFPASIRVQLGNRIFNLHKFPLSSRSAYFARMLSESSQVELPQEFPGGTETFEMIVLLIYGSSTLITPFNIAALRCAAEFLEMTEEFFSGNLCERFDLYMNQVVLQNWDDTLIVLQKCQSLLPWAEELLIVNRCIESLAFMACMEILDPDGRRDHPVITLEALATHPWSCETAKELLSQDLWMKDLVGLPFRFFKRITGSLRRQGMKEKYVSPIIVFYANKWVIYNEPDVDACVDDEVSTILNGILDLLPMGEKAGKAIPVGLYFALLLKSIHIGLKTEGKAKLQDQIASMLHLAQLNDFLLPMTTTESIASSKEVATMESIISVYVSSDMDSGLTPSENHSVVAELWDGYLCKIASDSKMRPKRFMQFIEAVPILYRQSHDHLYRALNIFLQTHLDMSQEEKGAVCKYLSCQKLSQEVCIEAVQNELMPLRLIVQALFIQQLNTQQAFKECSDSFRYTHFGEFSGSVSSSRCPFSKSQNLGESPYTDEVEIGAKPLSVLLQRDHIIEKPDLQEEDYESTSFRIQNLEKELVCLKKSLQMQSIAKRRDLNATKTQKTGVLNAESRSMSSSRRNSIGQMTGCIGSVSFASQRKYANRLMKIFRRITMFRSRKSKRKPGAPSSRAKSFQQKKCADNM